MKYIVVDCNYVCHEARFSVGALDNGVIYGFFNKMINVAETYQTNKFLFTWDSKKSIRKKYFPEYKKKRHKDLTKQERLELNLAYEQMDLLRKEILPSLGFKNNFIQAGVEGDDIMASLVLSKNSFKHKYYMVASDHDLYQLLSDNVCMIKPKQLYTEKSFRKEFGISPRQWKKVKSIGGCSSDEVPGIKGVGEKTVCKYLNNKLGEHTKAYQKIVSDEGRKIAKFNELLVNLPHPKTKEFDIVKDELDIKLFKKFFKQYKMKGFLRDRIDEWERFCNGR